MEMAVSYKKLWKLLIDLDMKKKDLQQAAGVSPALIAKLGRNENVSTESLVKICTALHCDIGDIMEVVQGKFHRCTALTKDSHTSNGSDALMQESLHGNFHCGSPDSPPLP